MNNHLMSFWQHSVLQKTEELSKGGTAILPAKLAVGNIPAEHPSTPMDSKLYWDILISHIEYRFNQSMNFLESLLLTRCISKNIDQLEDI